MNPFEMVVIIVLIGVAGGVLKSAFDSRAQRSNDQTQQTAENEMKRWKTEAQRIKKLEQRIEVLERIVTSDGYDLRQRFRELNDKQQETN